MGNTPSSEVGGQQQAFSPTAHSDSSGNILDIYTAPSSAPSTSRENLWPDGAYQHSQMPVRGESASSNHAAYSDAAERQAGRSSPHSAKINHIQPGKTSPKVDVGSAIAILQELKKTASPQDLQALHNALSSTEDNTKLSADSAAAALIRRKSLFTPGIATRSDGAKVLKKESKRKRNKLQTETWSPEMFRSSPLTQITRLSTDMSRPPLDRTATPDINTTYLGTHKLGTLRITNGCPSPEPSIRANPNRSLVSLGQAESYHTAEEEVSRRGSTDMLSSALHSPEIQDEGAVEAHDYLQVRPNVLGSGQTTPKVHRSPAEPHRFELHDDYERQQDLQEGDTVTRRTSKSSYFGIADPQRSFSVRRKPLRSASEDVGLHRTPTVAKRYISEVASNPFESNFGPETPVKGYDCFDADESFERTPESDNGHSTQLYNAGYQSYQTSIERHKSHYAQPVQREDIRSDALRKLNGRDTNDVSTRYYARPKSSPAKAVQPIKEDNDSHLRPKFDSGYVSESSVRTLDLTDRTLRNSGSSEGDMKEPTLPNVGLSERSTTPPTISRPEFLSRDSGATIKATPVQHSILKTQNLPSNYSTIANPPDDSPRPQSTIISKTTSAPEFPASSQSTPEKKNGGEKAGRKKLQKKRPLSYRTQTGPIVVQSSHCPVSVPALPNRLIDSHADRLHKFPGMEHLEHTYKSIGHLDPRDDTSVASPIPAPIEIKFPSPTPSPPPGAVPGSERGRRRRRSSSLKAGIIDKFRSKSRKASQERSRSKGKNGERYSFEEGDSAALTDFGNIEDFVGPTHYERGAAAYAGMTGSSPEKKTRNDESALRPKRATGMTAQQASAWAMQRSRDRVANIEAAGAVFDTGNSIEDSTPQHRSVTPAPPSEPVKEMEEIPPVPMPSVMKGPRPRSMDAMLAERERLQAVGPQRTEMTLGGYSDPTISDAFERYEGGNNHERQCGDYGELADGNPFEADARTSQPSQPETTDWAGPAKAWRARRNSIGEGLVKRDQWRRQQQRSHKESERAVYDTTASRGDLPSDQEDNSDLHNAYSTAKLQYPEPTLPQVRPTNSPPKLQPTPSPSKESGRWSPSPPRTASPSIAARAAIFEPPPPQRAPPSPPPRRPSPVRREWSADSLGQESSTLQVFNPFTSSKPAKLSLDIPRLPALSFHSEPLRMATPPVQSSSSPELDMQAEWDLRNNEQVGRERYSWMESAGADSKEQKPAWYEDTRNSEHRAAYDSAKSTDALNSGSKSAGPSTGTRKEWDQTPEEWIRRRPTRSNVTSASSNGRVHGFSLAFGSVFGTEGLNARANERSDRDAGGDASANGSRGTTPAPPSNVSAPMSAPASACPPPSRPPPPPESPVEPPRKIPVSAIEIWAPPERFIERRRALAAYSGV